MAERVSKAVFPSPIRESGIGFGDAILFCKNRVMALTIIQVNRSQAPIKMTILVGGSTTGALVSADSRTGGALDATDKAVAQSLDQSTAGVGNSLKRAVRAFRKAMRVLAPKGRK